MAKCKVCGKSGFFLKLNNLGYCSECAKMPLEKIMYITDEKYRKTVDDIEYQQGLLEIALKARDNYKKDKDASKAIVSYEKVLVKSNPPLHSHTHTQFLADLYIKAEEYDKAWGYLNSLIGTGRLPQEKIRKTQAEILKKEKKYLASIEYSAMEYLSRNTWDNQLEKDAFLKAVRVNANKLGWSEEQRESVYDLILKQKSSGNLSEKALVDSYRLLVKSFD